MTMPARLSLWWLRVLGSAAAGLGATAFAAEFPEGELSPSATAFIDRHCASCHNDIDKEAGLDLTELKFTPEARENFRVWAKVHDRIATGEMPPPRKSRPSPADVADITGFVARALSDIDRRSAERFGRAVNRRLNRYEYENVLRDLLDAPWLQLKEWLPEDGEAYRFNKVGESLDVSHVQVSRYLSAAEYALREVLARDPQPPASGTTRYYAREQQGFQVRMRAPFPLDRIALPVIGTEAQPDVRARKVPITAGKDDPETREREAFAVVHGNADPVELRFNGFRAPISGLYRLRVSAHSVWVGAGKSERWWVPNPDDISRGRRSEPITLYAEIPGRMRRRLGSFDAGPEPTTGELEVYLQAQETIRPDSARLFRSKPLNWRNPLATREGMPGVAYRWLEVEGPILTAWPREGHRLLFGDLPVTRAASAGELPIITPSDPRLDAERLLRHFIGRAYRRPVPDEEVSRFLLLIERALGVGRPFAEAMLLGYAAVLSSPEFLYITDPPGKLDDYALATRLSLFLINSAPDAELRAAAQAGRLRDSEVLREQTERLLRSANSQRFLDAFTDYWLDLRKLDATSPDATLYPDYFVDELLLESATEETRLFFRELVAKDLPARNIVSSDFTFLNERLGDHYGLPQPEGVLMRRIALPAGHVRGGLLTQASVLKVTANGTTTSPVLRGVWVLERILGVPSDPPPPGTPAVEPDTRGSTTIREQLDRHRADVSCASCHTKIDPPGFALESFDVFGGWRERYRAVREGVSPVPGFGRTGQPFAFHLGQPVDPSGALANGSKFADIVEFKRLLLRDERAIARSLTRQLIIYATGAPVRFGDRAAVEDILRRTEANGFRLRSLIHAVVQSPLFLQK